MHRNAKKLCAGALFAALAGCCTSYGRVATIEKTSVPDSPDIPGLEAVITDAVKQLGFANSRQESVDGGMTMYSVRDRRNAVGVLIDHQTLGVKIRWDRQTTADFASQVQIEIERRFTAKYHVPLQFADIPCGWLGP